MFKTTAITAFTTMTLCYSMFASAEADMLQLAQRAALQNAQSGFDRYLGAWSGSVDARNTVQDVFEERAHIELTLTDRPEWTVRIDGTTAIAEYVETMHAVGGQWTFSNVHYYPTMQPGIVFAQFDATGNGHSFSNLVVIELEGNQIVRLRDFNAASLLLQNVLTVGRSDSQPSRVARY